MRTSAEILVHVAVFLLSTPAQLIAQTTQATISGRVFDRGAASPLSGADVVAYNADNIESGRSKSNQHGYYVIGLLSPGTYRIRAEKSDYQGQEFYNLQLPVASQLEISFSLRAVSDVFGAETNRSALVGSDRIIPFFGEDTKVRLVPVDVSSARLVSLQPTLSNVIASREIEALPLAGRDVYAILALQPGITSDSTTGRGLGLSVNGQRPTASNYLLDGLQNNNYLVTGPLLTVAPEAIQEYRFSTNSFSAEYGRTAGFIANAVTRQGNNGWHGSGYLYYKNDHLNANDFERNAASLPVNTLRQSEPGIRLSGALIPNRLYLSASGDYLHFRSYDLPQIYVLPTDRYAEYAAPNTIARVLLDTFAHPLLHGVPGQATVRVPIAPPSSASVDQWLGLVRVDGTLSGGRHRWMVRPLAASLTRPDFLWTPYPDFITPLRQTNAGLAVSAISSLGRATNEAHFSVSRDHLGFDRRWPGIPTLSSGDATKLPGSPAFYAFREQGRNLQIDDHIILPAGRNVLRVGGDALVRWTQGYLTAGRDSLFQFQDFGAFARDAPFTFTASVLRSSPTRFVLPDYQRNYRYNQFSLFAEDSFRWNRRLVFDFGVRYENFGSPLNIGTVKDAVVVLGDGPDLGARLTGATLVFPGAGDQRLYAGDNTNFSIRAGFVYAIQPKGTFLLRGSFGTYYDPPFDNLWENLRNNNFTTASFLERRFPAPSPPLNYLQPIQNILAGYIGIPYSRDFPNLVLYQPGLRTGYAENFFLGLQKLVSGNLTLELNGLGSLGRRLITTDQVNRRNSVTGPAAPLSGRFNSSLPEISYRGSQGQSNYTAMTMVARYRRTRLQFQISYTLSHAIDNQSDPLEGDFFDLQFTSRSAAGGQNAIGFTRQFDSHGDRANANFDQRHNLVGYGIWDLPAWTPHPKMASFFRGWSVAGAGAIRSGFPFSVVVPAALTAGSPEFTTYRADIITPGAVYTSGSGLPGYSLWLNRAAFQLPAAGTMGNSGRNAFRGPGLYSLDTSLSRSFSIKIRDRQERVTLRADAFNLLNHANLNNPDAVLTSSAQSSPTFGMSTYGRQGQSSGFPAATPLSETPRQIQLMLRIDF